MKTMQTSYDAISGLVNLYAIPAELVLGIDQKEKILSIEDEESDEIINIPVEISNQYSFSEEMNIEDGGKIYEVKIAGQLQNEDDENTELIQELENREWIVVVIDASGVKSVSGTCEIPLRFTTSRKKGKSNKVSFEFSAKELYPSVLFQNDIGF